MIDVRAAPLTQFNLPNQTKLFDPQNHGRTGDDPIFITSWQHGVLWPNPNSRLLLLSTPISPYGRVETPTVAPNWFLMQIYCVIRSLMLPAVMLI